MINPHDNADNRFIPAGAGNTSALRCDPRTGAVHPRRRGEHSCGPCPAFERGGSSPQARGTLIQSAKVCLFIRFIPAGAGNTAHRMTRAIQQTVHPRRRGEHQK